MTFEFPHTFENIDHVVIIQEGGSSVNHTESSVSVISVFSHFGRPLMVDGGNVTSHFISTYQTCQSNYFKVTIRFLQLLQNKEVTFLFQ